MSRQPRDSVTAAAEAPEDGGRRLQISESSRRRGDISRGKKKAVRFSEAKEDASTQR